MIEDYVISLNEDVMIECDGLYASVCEAMKDDVAKKWMIRDEVNLKSNFGEALFILHFYYDGNVVISDFASSSNVEAYHNPDIRFISRWTQEKGWKIPKPLSSMIESNLDFWKHFWETHVVDSEYLDSKYGKREDIEFDDIVKED